MAVVPEISVVIPIYKSQSTLQELNSRILEHLASKPVEIIYVNDCSPDDSLRTLQQLTAQHQQVKLVDLAKNVGQQKATLEGLKKATGRKIIVMDGDLQDAPELIMDLFEQSSARTTVYVFREGAYQSKARMLTSRLIKYVMYLLSGLHYKAGSFYMMDQSILPRVVDVASECRHPYMSIIVAHFTDTIKYIPATRPKSIGQSGYSFIGRLYAAFKAIYCSLYCSYVKLIPAGKDS